MQLPLSLNAGSGMQSSNIWVPALMANVECNSQQTIASHSTKVREQMAAKSSTLKQTIRKQLVNAAA
jgi:hypothetical protein